MITIECGIGGDEEGSGRYLACLALGSGGYMREMTIGGRRRREEGGVDLNHANCFNDRG